LHYKITVKGKSLFKIPSKLSEMADSFSCSEGIAEQEKRVSF